MIIPQRQLIAKPPMRDIVTAYMPVVVMELRRLRQADPEDDTWFTLCTKAGYVQCLTHKNGTYCEAASSAFLPELADILTPERVAILHAAGLADPVGEQNYQGGFEHDRFDDAEIARILLTILRDVYGHRRDRLLTLTREHRPETPLWPSH